MSERSDRTTETGLRAACGLGAPLAARLREAVEALTTRWLERIRDRSDLEEDEVFPTEELLDHVPMLIGAIADYLEDPARELTVDNPVVAKAIELGELRYEQEFSPEQLLEEFEILGGILITYITGVMQEMENDCPPAEHWILSHRLQRALAVFERATTAHYLRLANQRVNEREQRLRSFNRMVSHELKNRVGAIVGAGDLLGEDWIDDDRRAELRSVIRKNGRTLQHALDDLRELSRLKSGAHRQRNVALPDVLSEAVAQVEEMAREREVELRVAGELPDVEIDGAATGLALTNYLSNAVKYSDPGKDDRWVEVHGREEERGLHTELIVEVRDNGLGVPEDARENLFERFFRAHEDVTVAEGSGMGLSIVRETIEALGGRAWAEFPDEGSVFGFAMPLRGEEDRDGRSGRGEEDG